MTTYAQMLREAADKLDLIDPHGISVNVCPPFFTIYNLGADEKATLQDVARSLGTTKKNYEGALFCLEHEMECGSLLRFIAYRESVCTRKVVGTETVPAHTIPESHVPETTREIVEWDCVPLFEGKEAK